MTKMKYNRSMYTGSYSAEDFVFFWGHTPASNGKITKACFSQWWLCDFNDDGIDFCCAEQYMMYHKALAFSDEEYAKKILGSRDQKEIKGFGRKIRNFDEAVWNDVKSGIVIKGNMLKFSQNPKLKEFLISTGDKILVEASPYDKIWGIGMEASAAGITDPGKWKGENLLGFALMEVRDMLR